MPKFLFLFCLLFLFLCSSAFAENIKEEPSMADSIIAECKKEPEKLWERGTPLAYEEGSNLYQTCLRKNIEALTKSYFYKGEKKQQQFLRAIDDTAQKYHSIVDDIYLAHKKCAVPAPMEKRCGTLDTVLAYGHINRFYEDILKTILSVRAAQREFKD